MMKVVRFSHPSLGSISEPVTSFGPELCSLVSLMSETMYADGGVGLAAPQVNVLQRVMLIDASGGEVSNQLIVMINPVVISCSKEMERGQEGCLSLPRVLLQVSRHQSIEVEYLDVVGNNLHHAKFTGLQARIIQHEVDHLDGITILDRVGHAQRTVALKELSRNR